MHGNAHSWSQAWTHRDNTSPERWVHHQLQWRKLASWPANPAVGQLNKMPTIWKQPGQPHGRCNTHICWHKQKHFGEQSKHMREHMCEQSLGGPVSIALPCGVLGCAGLPVRPTVGRRRQEASHLPTQQPACAQQEASLISVSHKLLASG